MFFHIFGRALVSRKPFGHKQVAITMFCPAERIQAKETDAPAAEQLINPPGDVRRAFGTRRCTAPGHRALARQSAGDPPDR